MHVLYLPRVAEVEAARERSVRFYGRCVFALIVALAPYWAAPNRVSSYTYVGALAVVVAGAAAFSALRSISTEDGSRAVDSVAPGVTTTTSGLV
jgi:hypothetical protein